MNNYIYNILIVDDEPDYREALSFLFESAGYASKTASSASEALELMEKEYFPIIVTDIMMEGIDGIEFLQMVKEKYHDEIEVIMVTGFGSIETAVETMKKGAFGYFIKSHDPDELLRELEKAVAKLDITRLHKITKENSGEFLLQSQNLAMIKIWDLVNAIADSNANVLITGESGTGKEIIANQIHRLSSRNSKPFIPINCQSFPMSLIESELFGHEKGAFTGATERRIGKLEQGNGGTLFLDEIGDLSLEGQVKLLRTLETRKIERLGSNKIINVDFRLVSATNRNIYDIVKSGQFREDFLYRINTIEINIPPLRERREDLQNFINFFVEKFSKETGKNIHGIEDSTLDYLMNYQYPGNIRELKNIIERLVILCEDDGILKFAGPNYKFTPGKQDIQEPVTPESQNPFAESATDYTYKEAKQSFERKYISEMLARTDGNITKAAELMELSRRQLFNKVKELELE